MKIRKIVDQVHLIFGLASGVVVLLVALTGCIWAFEEEIRYLTQHDALFVAPQPTAPIPVSRVLRIVHTADPSAGINQIRLFGDPARAIQVFTKDRRMLTVNPYTGQLLANGSLDDDWLLINLKLHRTLLLGDIGKKIVYWNA